MPCGLSQFALSMRNSARLVRKGVVQSHVSATRNTSVCSSSNQMTFNAVRSSYAHQMTYSSQATQDDYDARSPSGELYKVAVCANRSGMMTSKGTKKRRICLLFMRKFSHDWWGFTQNMSAKMNKLSSQALHERVRRLRAFTYLIARCVTMSLCFCHT